MATDTKPNLISGKFEQCVGDVLNLSGCTQIYGTMDIHPQGTIDSCSGYKISGVTTLINQFRCGYAGASGQPLIGQGTTTAPTWANLNTGYIAYKSASSFVDSQIYTDGTNIAIGTTTLDGKLNVSGKTKTATLQITTNAGAGKVLVSDASGNAAWCTLSASGIQTANNGLNVIGSNVRLGGALTGNTSITGAYTLSICGGAILNTTCGYQVSGSTIFRTSPNTISSILIGCGAGNNTSTGADNIGIGYQVLFKNTSGIGNIAIGCQSLQCNITGCYNVANGFGSLLYNTSGNNNIGLGNGSLYSNSIGCANIGVGYQALLSNSSGCYNIGDGFQALYSNTTGCFNIAHGFRTLYCNTTANNLIAIGTCALYNNTCINASCNGQYNIAVGHGALSGNTYGCANYAFGYGSLSGNTTGCYNVGIGYQTLTKNTTGRNNIAKGYQALAKNTIGIDNIANGYGALFCNTCGSYNIANGCQALCTNTTGCNNIANGYQALFLNTIGCHNIANGNGALFTNSCGSYNIANGNFALISNTTGCDNIGLGQNSGYLNSTGSLNIFIGRCAGYNETGSGKLYIATGATNQLIYGDFSIKEVTLPKLKLCETPADGTCSNSVLVWDSSSCCVKKAPYYSGCTGILTANNGLTKSGTNVRLGGALTGDTIISGSNSLSICGNVGIGTISPTYKLDVRGTTAANGVRSAMGYDMYPVPDPTSLSGVVSAGGSVDTGTHYYWVSFTTAIGETHAFLSSVITTTAGNNTVTLTVPTSTDPRVTGRKLYRTKAGTNYWLEYYLGAINDNVTTTYVDTAADSTLSGSNAVANTRANTTSYYLSVNGVRIAMPDPNVTIFGYNAGSSITTSPQSVYIGSSAGRLVTTGGYNTVVGYLSLYTNVVGASNSAFGTSTLRYTTGSQSSAFGSLALMNFVGDGSTGIGYAAGMNMGCGNSSTYLGYMAGYYLSNGSSLFTGATNSLYLGASTKGSANGVSNEIAIGQNAIAKGSNTAVWGNTSITSHYFSGSITLTGSAPTAKLHLPAGTATAGTAPLKLNSGTNLTNPEAGAVEFDGTNLYFTPSSTRRTVAFLDSPTFTGTPLAPTACAGTNTTQIATTAFVTTAVSAAGGGATVDDVAPTGSVGKLWFQPTNGSLMVYAGGAWVTGNRNGIDGKGWTGGSYNASTGIVTFGSSNGLGFSTGDLRASLTDDSVTYAKLGTGFKNAITDNDGAFDFSTAGIITANISGTTTISFTNLQRNKTLKVKLVITNSPTINFPSYAVKLAGSQTLANGTFYLYFDCWESTGGSELVLYSIMKAA
jgi:hypothetical protein